MHALHMTASSGEVLLESGIFRDVGTILARRFPRSRAAVITDDHVAPLYLSPLLETLSLAGIPASAHVFPAGESAKSLACLTELYGFLQENRMTRTDPVIALGGGVIGDLTGLAAATWLRGVPLVQVPTTLLAQVDASLGGKTAVDFQGVKNLIGTFYQPSLVFCDPCMLRTLSPAQWRNGLGEVVKYACIGDPDLFTLLEEAAPRGREGLMKQIDTLLLRCIEQKIRVVEQDVRDTGIRMILNFGHTLAHALEACQNFEGLSHGEAVSIGMDRTTRLSEARGLTEKGTWARLHQLLTSLCLETELPPIPSSALLSAMQMDKKHTGRVLHLIILERIGACRILDTSPSFFFDPAD